MFIYPPEGYKYKNKLLKLRKALYGLKQAPLCWNTKFTKFLQEKGFEPMKTENCIFKSKTTNVILGIYVDDGIIIRDKSSDILNLLDELKNEYKVTINTNPSNYVGFDIEINKNRIKLVQSNYIE